MKWQSETSENNPSLANLKESNIVFDPEVTSYFHLANISGQVGGQLQTASTVTEEEKVYKACLLFALDWQGAQPPSMPLPNQGWCLFLKKGGEANKAPKQLGGGN